MQNGYMTIYLEIQESGYTRPLIACSLELIYRSCHIGRLCYNYKWIYKDFNKGGKLCYP